MEEIKSWLETPAAAFRQAMGLPVPDESELRFESEREMRAAALRAFNAAHRPGADVHEPTPFERQSELAEQAQAGQGWIPVDATDAAAIIQRMNAQRLADQVARDADVYGPPGGNPRTREMIEKMREASARTNEDWARGEPLPAPHVGRTVL